MKQKIWNKLRENKIIIVKDIINSFLDFEIKKETVKQYLNALYKAKYIIASNATQRGLTLKSEITLVKNTGAIAPTFYKGILRDKNSLEEIQIHKDKDYKTKNTYLKYYLQAIVELNKEEVLNSILINKFKEICPKIEDDNKSTYTKVTRYMKKLIEKEYIIKQEVSGRSFYLQFDLKKTNELYQKCKNLNTYNIL
jgi:predicted transcriptional regulator